MKVCFKPAPGSSPGLLQKCQPLRWPSQFWAWHCWRRLHICSPPKAILHLTCQPEISCLHPASLFVHPSLMAVHALHFCIMTHATSHGALHLCFAEKPLMGSICLASDRCNMAKENWQIAPAACVLAFQHTISLHAWLHQHDHAAPGECDRVFGFEKGGQETAPTIIGAPALLQSEEEAYRVRPCTIRSACIPWL